MPWRYAAWLLLILACATSVLAEEPLGVSLFSPNSLAGWEHAPNAPSGWTMVGTILRGSKDSTPLLSGWTFGNFELRFRWSVNNGGEWKVSLPQVPKGEGVVVTLANDHVDYAYRIPGHVSDKRATPATTGDKSHATVIRREGKVFTIQVDGRDFIREAISEDLRIGLSLSLTKGKGELSDLRVQEFGSDEEPAGTPLFNEKDLAGWWTPGSKNAWGVKDGHLALMGGGGNYLRSEKEYGNFTLSLEYKIRKRGNSGVGIRTARNGWPSSDGMEMQIEDSRKLDASATMAIYRNLEPIALNEKTEDWNHAVIKADGRMISGWLNGALVQQTNTHDLPELRHRPLAGWIGFQDHGAPIEFRNLRIIEAPPGLGLDAWYTPRPEPAAAAILDRLMNPERLTRHDGTTSGSISTAIRDGSEHVLADLKGRGALVRVTSTGNSGKLAFYFDGEANPRIECPARDLHQHVPLVCGDSNPLLTFLGYQESVKVTLRDAKPSDYRLDYVTLPPEMPVETFRHKTESMPRGLLAAIDYRHFQMGHGTYRDNDPLPRAASGNKTLKLGERVNLVSLPGAGIVQWLRLNGDMKLLANDDLWLEVTIDGESQPALAAPARFLFPGLENGQNYHNFLVLNKGGFQNVLPMPYAAGLSIAAVNRGAKDLKGFHLTASYEPLPAEQVANRLRLRGIFTEAGASSAHELIAFQGKGRWLGFVCQTPEKDPVLSLHIDETRSVWEKQPWRLLTGLAAGDLQTRCTSGQAKSLAWCFHLLAPPEFKRSLRLESNTDAIGSRLSLFYTQ